MSNWSAQESKIFDSLPDPYAIQGYLDALPYRAESSYHSPRDVIRDGRAHCFDGALFAAAALRNLGHEPRLLDLRAVNDDDHVLAIYQRHGCFGSIAKSNFVGLRFREPVYKNLRELALSYFELYFNAAGEKTLREYSVPLELVEYDEMEWMTSNTKLERIADALDDIQHELLLTKAMEADLSPVDQRSLDAGMLGTDEAGLYQLE